MIDENGVYIGGLEVQGDLKLNHTPLKELPDSLIIHGSLKLSIHLMRFTHNRLKIGCKLKTIEEWDEWFFGNEEFEEKRRLLEFIDIKRGYILFRDYLIRTKRVLS